MLLVGYWGQLQSVDAGGAFTLLASTRTDTPELSEVHRFTNEWERTASLSLRFGRTDVIGTYLAKDRVREGSTDEMMAVTSTTARPRAVSSGCPQTPRSVGHSGLNGLMTSEGTTHGA